MSFQSQPLPNGLPAATQLDPFNKFQPPTITGQYQPPMTQQNKLPPTLQQQQPQPQQPNQTQQFNSHYQPPMPQNRQQLLVNGGSNSSSRTASPAPNQSINSSHLPPTQPSKQFVGPSQMSSQNQHLFPPRQSGSLHGSTQNLSNQSSVNPNVANLATNMQNINITNGQHSSNVAANPYVPNLVNGNTNLLHTSRMPPVNGSSNQQSMGPAVQKPPNLQQQQNFNGQMQQQPQQIQHQQNFNGQMQQQHQQYPAMPPPSNNHMQSNQVASPINNMQAPPQSQPPFSQSHVPNQMKPPGPALNQPQYPNQFQNNNNPPNAAPPLFPPTTATTAAFNKRPMYPAQPSAQPTSLQQHQTPPTQNAYPSQQSNAFAGQTNNAPIQYQNSKQSNFPLNPMGVSQQGFNKMWGHETVDLMQQRHILPTNRIVSPAVELGHEFYESVNCSSE